MPDVTLQGLHGGRGVPGIAERGDVPSNLSRRTIRRVANMTNKTPPEENNGLKWVENGLLRKDRIVDAAALIEASRYLEEHSKQPPEDVVGSGNDFQKDLRMSGVTIAAQILRPFATEQALKAMYEWENDHKKKQRSEHKLIELYHALSPQSQKLLKEQYLVNSRLHHDEPGTQPTLPIEELLEEFNDAFQEQRYFTEDGNFKPGYSSPNFDRLDIVVQAAWEILSKDPKMKTRMFNFDALIRLPPDQQANEEPHIVRRKPIYYLTRHTTPSEPTQGNESRGQ